MKKFCNRSLALLLALILCLSALSGVALPASAVTVEYRYGETGNNKFPTAIYNWGNRGVTATFLSPNAEKFYRDNNTSYGALAALAGSSNLNSVPSSSLFTTLRKLMADNHSHETTYDDTRDLFAFTDCQNSALRSSCISSFYAGSNIGPAWDKGATWNREHTWPNSKGDANGNGENDIMMLRPANKSNNSSRGNKAYGESSSYYNPNSESENTYDLRGDVARIVLYVYVRWQNTGSSAAVLFGTNGVIESKDVLLKWLQEDPVDTWEMGRNDSVESITGTRNVFVDYPELGFILFGEETPTDYTSPSGGVSSDSCSHSATVSTTVAATCTKNGSITVSCSSCGKVVSTTVLTATGHSYSGGVCTGCGISDPSSGPAASAGDYVLVTPDTATEGQYIIGATRAGNYPNLYLGTSSISGDWTTTTTTVTAQNNAIKADALPSGTQVLTLTGNNESGFSVGFTVNGTMQYLGYSSTTASRKLALGTQYKTTLWKILAKPDGSLVLSSSYGAKNYVISQNSTGTEPIRGYYTGTIYTGIYLFRQVDAVEQPDPVATVGDVEYTSFADAYAAAKGAEIKLLADIQLDKLALSGNVNVDLNGNDFFADGITGAYTITVKDNATDDYAKLGGTATFTGDDTFTVQAADGYAMYKTNNGYTFNAYKLAITHVSLDAKKDALGYKATLKGNANVQAAVTSYGFTMGVIRQETVSKNGKIDDGVFSLRLTKIMATKGGEKEIVANAFVIFGSQKQESQTCKTSMQKTILAVNDIFSTLSKTQQAAVQELYSQYASVMDKWMEGKTNHILPA